MGAGRAEGVVGYVGDVFEVVEDLAGFGRGEVLGGLTGRVRCGVPEGGHEFASLLRDPRVGAVVVDQVQAGVGDRQRPAGFGERELGWCGGRGGGEHRQTDAEGGCGEQCSSHTASVVRGDRGYLGVNPGRIPHLSTGGAENS